MLADWAAKPDEIAAHVVGHEGAGSLLAALRAVGWASGLTAGLAEGAWGSSRAASLFEVGGRSSDGVAQQDEDALFTIKRLTRPRSWRWVVVSGRLALSLTSSPLSGDGRAAALFFCEVHVTLTRAGARNWALVAALAHAHIALLARAWRPHLLAGGGAADAAGGGAADASAGAGDAAAVDGVHTDVEAVAALAYRFREEGEPVDAVEVRHTHTPIL